jgi:hypothetical protein
MDNTISQGRCLWNLRLERAIGFVAVLFPEHCLDLSEALVLPVQFCRDRIHPASLGQHIAWRRHEHAHLSHAFRHSLVSNKQHNDSITRDSNR